MIKVWIDQDLCTGDGICQELCPELFGANEDGLYYVKEESWPNIMGPTGVGDAPKYQMGAGQAHVPDHLLETAIEAAEECPGECIFFDSV